MHLQKVPPPLTHKQAGLCLQGSPPGRILLRCLIDLSTTVCPLHHHITLTRDARADLTWWMHFLPTWSGSSLFLESEWLPSPEMELYTDASSAGYGAYLAGRWFNAARLLQQTHQTIAWKELYAVLVACSTWGHHWARRRVLFHCHNVAVIAIWDRGSCKCPHLMSLVRQLFFLAAGGNYHVGIAHISGVDNRIADHLSRFSMREFRQAAPGADAVPTHHLIPVPLLEF